MIDQYQKLLNGSHERHIFECGPRLSFPKSYEITLPYNVLKLAPMEHISTNLCHTFSTLTQFNTVNSQGVKVRSGWSEFHSVKKGVYITLVSTMLVDHDDVVKFSALLAICAGNSPVPGEFPAQRPVTRSFDDFFDLRPNKRSSKQSWGWWFQTQ